MRPGALAILAFVLLAPQAATAQDYVFPGEEWESLWPRAQALREYGWSPEGLRRAHDFVRDSSVATGVVVVDRGRVVLEFGDIDELSYLASARKSVLAILYGPHVEAGTIDLNATLADLGMDDVGGLLDSEQRATIEHLITARSGVFHEASNAGDDLASAPARGSQPPGTYMLYSNWDFNAAGAAFEKTTGIDIYDALERQLAIPLEFEDWDRSAQHKSGNLKRSQYPAYHMWLSTRDMARIGYLMLREGRWGDRPIVSADWVRRITSPVTGLGEMNPVRRRDGYFGYGYMWWVFDGPRAVGPFEGAYTARGAVGQWITVLPVLDLVVALKTKSDYGRTTSWQAWERLLELLIEAKGVEMQASFPWQQTDTLRLEVGSPEVDARIYEPRVEERGEVGNLAATWWLLDEWPYMVYGEIVLPDGRVQRMTEVKIS